MLARMGQREWALVAIVAALIVGVLFYFFAIQPMQSQIATLNQQINLLTFQRNQGLAAQRALPELQATIASLEAQKQVFLLELPPEEHLAQVLASIDRRAQESGVTIESLARSLSQSQVPGVRSVNLGLRVSSPFPELYVFLTRLEKMRRFSTISGLQIQVGKQVSNPQLTTSMTMTVYVYTGKGVKP